MGTLLEKLYGEEGLRHNILTSLIDSNYYWNYLNTFVRTIKTSLIAEKIRRELLNRMLSLISSLYLQKKSHIFYTPLMKALQMLSNTYIFQYVTCFTSRECLINLLINFLLLFSSCLEVTLLLIIEILLVKRSQLWQIDLLNYPPHQLYSIKLFILI